MKHYPLSWAAIVLIWLLSLCPVFPETPLDNVAFIDKWVHIIMYGGTWSIVWTEYARRHRRPEWHRLCLWVLAAPVMMSGAIELIQEYCTAGARSGDWLDLAANTTGIALAFAGGAAYYKLGIRN